MTTEFGPVIGLVSFSEMSDDIDDNVMEDSRVLRTPDYTTTDVTMNYNPTFTQMKDPIQSIINRKKSLLQGHTKPIHVNTISQDDRSVKRTRFNTYKKSSPPTPYTLHSLIKKKIHSKKRASLFRRPKILGLQKFFGEWRTEERKKRTDKKKKEYVIQRWKVYEIGSNKIVYSDGLEKFNSIIHALNRLDELGYRRSKQQVEFHTAFLGSMVQQIFGKDLNRYLPDILQALGLDKLSKDIAVCCPRRFGKSTAVALYVASIIYTQGDMDIVIYSIAMRTSRMLTARIYQMIVILAGGDHIITTSNQEILSVNSINGGQSTVYSYPAASKISIYIYIYFHSCLCVYYFCIGCICSLETSHQKKGGGYV